MLITGSIYEKKTTFIDQNTLHFFIQACAQAIHTGMIMKRTTLKDRVGVAFATSVVDFDEDEDKDGILRKDMNRRGIVRDFIGIDWDFESGEEQLLKQVLIRSAEFAKEHDTIVLFYPTYSYPEKPRARTVLFTEDLLEQEEYTKAVQSYTDFVGVSTGDDGGNYSIKSNFNLPVINKKCQATATRLLLPSGQTMMIASMMKKNDDGDWHTSLDSLPEYSLLESKIWESVSVRRVSYVGTSGSMPEHEVDDDERTPRTDRTIDRSISVLVDRISGKRSPKIVVDEYYKFFQLLHAIARAEVIGSITREQAIRILIGIAMGESEWEQKNVRDYEVEFQRVADSEEKLSRARPMYYYVGDSWYQM